MALIQTENLTKIYGKGEAAVTALDHVNVSVADGLAGGVPFIHADVESVRMESLNQKVSHFRHQTPNLIQLGLWQVVENHYMALGNDQCVSF